MTLKLHFDPNQEYQLEAVQSVVDLFAGYTRPEDGGFQLQSDNLVINEKPSNSFNANWLLGNLHAVQARNRVPVTPATEVSQEGGLSLMGNVSYKYPSFTVEMETGTGKTYVYLRTIHELRRHYGWSKFVIVVPSVAIYEGVRKTFAITRNHFRALYGNTVVNLVPYDGGQISRLRDFATSTFVEILLITLDAFNKTSNVLYRRHDKLPGARLPFQYIAETRPILILDEPQNMASDQAQQALGTLNPLFALRYSATHRHAPNPIYRLTPFEAFRRNLVKKIQVAAVHRQDDANRVPLTLKKIERVGKHQRQLVAHLSAPVVQAGQATERTLTLKQGDDLHAKTGHPDHHGFIVSEIHAGQGWVAFANGETLRLSDLTPENQTAIFRVQIEETLRHHFEQQARLRPLGIKVLSLFFVDRVASYTGPEASLPRLFDEAYERLKPRWQTHTPEQVRRAYFAHKPTKTGAEAVDTTGKQGERELEKQAFNLIMRDKERLLSFEEPVSFIFAHSALKEGWDNPNVFQICTLRDIGGELQRRQTLGRGMRLCVNQEGERVLGDEVNVLTIIANERFRDFALGLQAEYRATGDAPPPPPTEAGKATAQRNEALFARAPDFHTFWEKLARHAHYRIDINTPKLIEACVARLNAQTFPEPLVVVETGRYTQTHYSLALRSVGRNRALLIIRATNSDGETNLFERHVELRASLADTLKDDSLAQYQVTDIRGSGASGEVVFGNGVHLSVDGTPHEFAGEPGRVLRERASLAPQVRYPVFNLIERAARATDITRPTVLSIFKQMRPDKKAQLLRNPEGFAGVFVAEIKNTLADQVAHSIIFEIADTTHPLPLETLFPPARKFPQRELVAAGERGLYDQVQLDSEVEANFVAKLQADPAVVLFFKFPAAYKVRLPRLIGNYNPDWGIVRRRTDGRYIVELIRETKGGTVDTLRFAHEKRKIRCAEAYFDAVGMDYREIHPPFGDWWKLKDEVEQQAQLE